MTARGRQWEQTLDDYHAILRMRALADVRRVPTPVHVTGRDGAHVTGALTRAEWVDYVGVLRGGRAVYVEAKASADPQRWRVSQVADHQLALLAAAATLGAVALVVLCCEAPGPYYGHTYCLTPADCVRGVVVGRASQSSWEWHELEARGARVPPRGGWYEWGVE